MTMDAVREAITLITEAKTTLVAFAIASAPKPLPQNANTAIWRLARALEILAALDSRAGDAFDMPEYAPDDISHLEGLASYLDGVARDKGRAGLPASKSLFEEIAKRLREYDAIRNRGRAGDAGEEIDNGYTADEAVDFVFNRLAEKLGLAEWQVVEGSEEWDGDVSATLHRLLIDAGIIDDETGAVATLATPAPAVDAVPAGEVVQDALSEAIGALQPFADADEGGPEDEPHMAVWPTFTVGDLRRAVEAVKTGKAALSHGEGRKPE